MSTAPDACASTLILGGARSGKSRLAERLATATGLTRVYIATAQARDEEMKARIARHRADRGAGWVTIEAPLDLAGAIAARAAADHAAVVDCLTLWLSNIMLAERDVAAETAKLESAVARASGPLFLVSNEVGLGVVPENALARRFRDAQGLLNQSLACLLPRVVFVAAGLPLALKGSLDDAA